MTDKNTKPPSQLQNPSQQNPSQQQNPQQVEKKQNNNNPNSQPWTFGYPQCVNKKESRLVCLHKDCQKYPFFCSSCEDESCEKQHTHKDRITSIGFKQLVRRLITERKPPEDLQKSVNFYKQKLQQMLQSVNEFVEKQTQSMDELLKNSFNIDGQEAFVVQKLKEKRYQQIKGKQLDKVWNKVAPSQHKKKMQSQMIKFIDSKRVQVQEMTKNFQDGINQNQQKRQHTPVPQKSPSQNSQVPSSNTKPKQ